MGKLFFYGVLFLQILGGLYSHCYAEIIGEEKNAAQPQPHPTLPKFGRSMKPEFLIAPGYVNLNHGSFGTYPKAVQRALIDLHLRAEAKPDVFMRRQVRGELDKVREQLAVLVNAPAEDIVMIPNVTGGMNALFRSMIFEMGERILYFSTAYGGVVNILNFVSDFSDGLVRTLQFKVDYPISNADLLVNFEKFLDENKSAKIRIALIDHISSVPSVLVPIEPITKMLKKRNILVLIDGAHAIGQVPINITALDPDYYITDCHKWLYAPRGCGMMYVAKRNQATIHPAHISWDYSRPSHFQDEFYWTGTMDYTPYLSVPAALEFRRSVGGEAAIMRYNHQLAVEGGKYLARRFGTEVLQQEDQIANMVDVRLPIAHPNYITPAFFINTLLDNYPVFAALYQHTNGQFYTRVSAQIYNDMADFEILGNSWTSICNHVNSNFTVLVK